MTKAISKNKFFNLLQKECNKRIIKYFMRQHKNKMRNRFQKPTKIDVFSKRSFVSLSTSDEDKVKVEPQVISLFSN